MTGRPFPDGARDGGRWRGSDPCTDLQADISALLDRELDDSKVRRVLVHLEVCPKCHRFLRSLRTQADLHREIWQRVDSEPAAGHEEDPFAGDLFEGEAAEAAGVESGESFLEAMLQEGDERLGEVFYQLGRAYVLLTSSPEFFSCTVREPVPIPEYRLRGKALLAGVGGSASALGRDRPQWTEARCLLDGQLDSSAKNLGKGRKLLEQSLRLRPGSCSTRVMLGQCFLYQNQLGRARVQFQAVLRQTRKTGGPADPLTRVPLRIYALESLGNICLQGYEPEAALRYFRRVVESGAMDLHETFATSLLNVGLAALRVDRHGEAAEAFETYYRRFPGKRRETAEMLALKPEIRRLVDRDAATVRRLEASCPLWFGGEPVLANRAEVAFQRVYDPDSGRGGRCSGDRT